MSANDKQINGDHYRGAIQTWDYIVANDLGFLEGNIVKYVTRFRKKNGVQDLLKAQHYLQKLIEVENGRLCRTPDTNVKDQQTVASIIAESENRYGERTGSNVAYRNQVVAELRQRNETGYGQPTTIGEIT
jgi:aromatic ring hydroxylase